MTLKQGSEQRPNLSSTPRSQTLHRISLCWARPRVRMQFVGRGHGNIFFQRVLRCLSFRAQVVHIDMKSWRHPWKPERKLLCGLENTASMMWVVKHCIRLHIIIKVIQYNWQFDIFLQHTKPLKGERQVFYPTPPKSVLPNPKLRDWHLSLSERTSNVLKNLERTLWITSYQMHYTGKV